MVLRGKGNEAMEREREGGSNGPGRNGERAAVDMR